MYGDHTDRTDLNRMADDGCPHDATWDAGAADSPEGTVADGKDDRYGW
jgi:hypothetical protein